jgi:hypothetical protein
MVERRPERTPAIHTGGDHGHVRPEGPQQQRERPVELVTEPASPPGHDLAEQLVLGQHDGLGQVDAQVLERHRQQVGPVQIAERRRVEGRGRRDGDAVEIAGKGAGVHAPMLDPPGYPVGGGRAAALAGTPVELVKSPPRRLVATPGYAGERTGAP